MGTPEEAKRYELANVEAGLLGEDHYRRWGDPSSTPNLRRTMCGRWVPVHFIQLHSKEVRTMCPACEAQMDAEVR